MLGVQAYVHVFKIKKDNLDECSMVGILVRINEMKKGYKCYILVLKNAILSKDLVIDESTKFTFHLESIESKEDEERQLRLRGSFPLLMKTINCGEEIE
jgi:hypothetical protein